MEALNLPENNPKVLEMARSMMEKHIDEMLETVLETTRDISTKMTTQDREGFKLKIRKYLVQIENEITQDCCENNNRNISKNASFGEGKSNVTLWQIGLLVFILAGLVNTVLMNAGIGGLPRELSRLSVLIGLGLLIVGLIKRKK